MKNTINLNHHTHHSNLQYNTLLVKPVVKANEMDADMYKRIERWAMECYEDPRLKLKDEIVSFYLNFIFITFFRI